MIKQLKRRIEMVETCCFGSPRVAAIYRAIYATSDEEIVYAIQCIEENRINDLPSIFDVSDLTLEELQAYRGVAYRLQNRPIDEDPIESDNPKCGQYDGPLKSGP